MLNVAVVDNDQLAFYGVRYLLDEAKERNIQIVNECRSVAELIEISAASIPDVVLLDVMLGLPTSPLVVSVRQLQKWGTKVLAFSADPTRREVVQAIRATGVNFVPKLDMTAQELCVNIKATAAGDFIYSPIVGEAALLSGDGPELTPREKQVMKFCSLGYPNGVIARRLDISIQTLNGHIRKVCDKYRKAGRPIDSRIYMMWAALEDGVVEDVDEIFKANSVQEEE